MSDTQIHRVVMEKTFGKTKETFVFSCDQNSVFELADSIEAMQGKHGFDTIDACVLLSELRRKFAGE